LIIRRPCPPQSPGPGDGGGAGFAGKLGTHQWRPFFFLGGWGGGGGRPVFAPNHWGAGHAGMALARVGGGQIHDSHLIRPIFPARCLPGQKAGGGVSGEFVFLTDVGLCGDGRWGNNGRARGFKGRNQVFPRGKGFFFFFRVTGEKKGPFCFGFLFFVVFFSVGAAHWGGGGGGGGGPTRGAAPSAGRRAQKKSAPFFGGECFFLGDGFLGKKKKRSPQTGRTRKDNRFFLKPIRAQGKAGCVRLVTCGGFWGNGQGRLFVFGAKAGDQGGVGRPAPGPSPGRPFLAFRGAGEADVFLFKNSSFGKRRKRSPGRRNRGGGGGPPGAFFSRGLLLWRGSFWLL